MTIAAVPLSNFGIEIRGLDLSEPIPEAVQREMYALWLDHGILVFRGIGTATDRHLRLARCFGPLRQHSIPEARLKEDPTLTELATDSDSIPVQYVNGEQRRGFIYWHSDGAFVPDLDKGALLRMIETPAKGGSTAWTDTAAAYADLPEDMKVRLAGLSTIQQLRYAVSRPWGQTEMTLRVAPDDRDQAAGPDLPMVVQPMIITHSETGKKSLLASPLCYVRIDGMEQAESDLLFDTLCRHTLQEKYRYTHEWQVGDMVLWDNRRTMHCALGYPVGMRRKAQRASFAEVQTTGRLYEPAGVAAGQG
jgi:taurine dioxygenase